MSDFLPLNQYPDAIREIGLGIIKARNSLAIAESELDYREAWLRMYGGVSGSNDKARDAKLKELMSSDQEYRMRQAKVMEAKTLKGRLEVELQHRKDEFAVLRLETQERIAFARMEKQIEDLEEATVDNGVPF